MLALNKALERAEKGLEMCFCPIRYLSSDRVSALCIGNANARLLILQLSNILI